MSQNIERIDAKPPTPPSYPPNLYIHHIPAVLIFPCTPIVVDPPPSLPAPNFEYNIEYCSFNTSVIKSSSLSNFS